MKIAVRNPSSKKKFFTDGGGLKSAVSYRNETFWAAMNQLFGVRKNEKITGLVLTDEGITATFEKVDILPVLKGGDSRSSRLWLRASLCPAPKNVVLRRSSVHSTR